MSMILDALRKSEADRRRAQSPDLFAEPVAVAQPRSAAQPRWQWWLLAAVALLLVVWLAREWRASSARVTEPDTETETIARTGAELNRDPTPKTAPAMRTDDATPASIASPTPRPIAPLAAAPSPLPSPATVVTPIAASPMEPAPPITTTEFPSRPAPRAPEPIESPPAQPALAIADPVNTIDTLRLTDLSTEERKQLPPLKISMHMWNPAAAQRFVIIDGARVGQGDRIGDAVIEQITADGVVLAWQGRRLKLSMR